MNKENLKNKLLAVQEEVINELTEKVSLSHSMVDIDEGDTIDPEDFSHQFEAGEMEQMMTVKLNRMKKDLERLKSIDFSVKSKISIGAFVQTNKFNFFVGFSTAPFDVDGVHVIGISLESPIFAVMMDKVEGDEFNYGGVHYQIEKIN